MFFLYRFFTWLSSYSSLPARPSMLSFKQSFVMLRSPILTVSWWPSIASIIMLPRKMLRSVVGRRQFWHTQTDMWNPFRIDFETVLRWLPYQKKDFWSLWSREKCFIGILNICLKYFIIRTDHIRDMLNSNSKTVGINAISSKNHNIKSKYWKTC